MSNDAFLPEDYAAPTGGTGKYTKIQTGETRLRILSNPILGYAYWNTQNKPVRLKERPNGDPADMRKVSSNGFPEKVKHFWAVKVYNYATAQMEVWEISQASIQADLQKYSRDADWGHPKNYDIKVTKSGAAKDTTYAVIAVPAKEVSEEVKAAFKSSPINLEALFNPGADPFASNAATPSAMATPAPAAAPVAATPPPAPVAPQAAPQYVGSGRVEEVSDLPF